MEAGGGRPGKDTLTEKATGGIVNLTIERALNSEPEFSLAVRPVGD